MYGKEKKMNVVNIKRNEDPKDLMTFKQLMDKHGYTYSYLYKKACIECVIPIYPRGKLKVSERDVIEFEKRKARKYGKYSQTNVQN